MPLVPDSKGSQQADFQAGAYQKLMHKSIPEAWGVRKGVLWCLIHWARFREAGNVVQIF